MSPANSVDHRTLVLTRPLDVPRARVFGALTTPEQVAQWWGPEGFNTEHCEMDISAAPVAYRGCGLLEARHVLEIVAPERLVFTVAWEDGNGDPGHQTVVTVTLEDLGGWTRLTLRQAAFETTVSCEDHLRMDQLSRAFRLLPSQPVIKLVYKQRE